MKALRQNTLVHARLLRYEHTRRMMRFLNLIKRNASAMFHVKHSPARCETSVKQSGCSVPLLKFSLPPMLEGNQ